MNKILKISAGIAVLGVLFFAGIKTASWFGKGAEEENAAGRATTGSQPAGVSVAQAGAPGAETAPTKPEDEPPLPRLRRPRWSRGMFMDVSKNPAFEGLSATAVTIDYEAQAPEEAMRKVYESLKIPLPPNGRASTFLTGIGQTSMHLQEVPYLEGLLEFSAMTNARLRNLTPEMLEFSPLTGGPVGSPLRDESSVGVWCVAGPFAVSLDRIDTSVSLPVGMDAARTSAITFTLLAEPTVRVAAYPRMLNLERFVDNKNQPLQLGTPQATAGGNRTPTTLRIPLEKPAAPGARIAMLKGTAVFLVMSDSTQIKVPVPLTQPVTQTVNGMKIELLPPDGATTSPIQSIRIKISRGEAPMDRWQQMAPALAGLSVQAFGKGQPANPPNVRSQTPPISRAGRAPPAPPGNVDETVVLVATFARSNTVYPPADEAVISIPSGIREVPVPFEFRDLALP